DVGHLAVRSVVDGFLAATAISIRQPASHCSKHPTRSHEPTGRAQERSTRSVVGKNSVLRGFHRSLPHHDDLSKGRGRSSSAGCSAFVAARSQCPAGIFPVPPEADL